ncbi:MAG: AAA family ATPase [Syntrophales bacterium]
MFTWKPMYMELAKKLLDYRERRHELIKLLSDATDEWLKVIKLKDKNSEGNEIPLADIDPFTFFASFNRGQTEVERKKILQFMKNRFHLLSPLPDDFEGLPVVNAQSSWFFAYVSQRGENDIDILWDMAEAAIKSNINDIDSDLFKKCLTVRQSGIVNITMGLFWINPDTYIALDRKNKALLDNYDIDTNITDWDSYTKLLESVKSELGANYAAISHDANLIATGQKEMPPKNGPQVGNTGGTKKEQGHALNTILYGPPGTGKTYTSFSRAVQIIDGDSSQGDFTRIKSRFDELVEKGQIRFITFHQSYSYEDFVEGFRPVIECDEDAGDNNYECRDGIFKRICALAKSDKSIAAQKLDVDVEKVQIWKMSLGDSQIREDDHIYDDCISGNFIAHGSGRGVDFNKYTNKDEIEKKLAEFDWSNWKTTLGHHVSQVVALKMKMQIGDLVIVSDGNHKFRAIGMVTGDYNYDKNYRYQQQRPVTWLRVFAESQTIERILKDKVFCQLTLYQLYPKDLKIDTLKDLITQKKTSDTEKYVLIIDEINRGNISKILGELITLLEPDKRLGAKYELTVTLPYSQEIFGVPGNVYIVGTMNTADKSIALVDVALRRRFDFEELMPDFSLCKSLSPEMRRVLAVLNERIVLRRDRDHQIGHAYFMDVNDSQSFNSVFKKNIIPLLQEYFWNDLEGLRFVLGEESKDSGRFIQRIPNSNMQSARNKWQWFSDAGIKEFDYLEQLKTSYLSESSADG